MVTSVKLLWFGSMESPRLDCCPGYAVVLWPRLVGFVLGVVYANFNICRLDGSSLVILDAYTFSVFCFLVSASLVYSPPPLLNYG